jgi:hypothetical protein
VDPDRFCGLWQLRRRRQSSAAHGHDCPARRIHRGLYHKPSQNALTCKTTVRDYSAVIDAIVRRDQIRWLIDGMTAANILGLTNAVPAKIDVLVDARLKTVIVGNQKIVFKLATPSRLYWVGRPSMNLVQALYWLHDIMPDEEEREAVRKTVRRRLADNETGLTLMDDLRGGLSAKRRYSDEQSLRA